MSWELRVDPAAERLFARLPEGVAAAIVEFVTGPLCEDPERVGRPLQRELSGQWSARRGAYRVVYRIDHDAQAVIVLRVGHRSDVYRSR